MNYYNKYYKEGGKIKKICLASSNLFKLMSNVYGWMAPLGDAIGCIGSLDDIDNHNINPVWSELERAVTAAIDLSKNRAVSDSQRRILRELSSVNVQPENIGELIAQADAFQTQYCTEADKNAIMKIFEGSLMECIPQYSTLSKYYILSTNMVSIKKLKDICVATDLIRKDISEIRRDTEDIKGWLYRFGQLLTAGAREVVFALISMVLFLFAAVFFEGGFPPFWIISALICYVVSGILVQALKINRKLNAFLSKHVLTAYFSSCFFNMIASAFISLACFLIVILSGDDSINFNFHLAIGVFFAGSVLSSAMRFYYEDRLENTNNILSSPRSSK